jgi:Family of unknown function (DUF6594)
MTIMEGIRAAPVDLLEPTGNGTNNATVDLAPFSQRVPVVPHENSQGIGNLPGHGEGIKISGQETLTGILETPPIAEQAQAPLSPNTERREREAAFGDFIDYMLTVTSHSFRYDLAKTMAKNPEVAIFRQFKALNALVLIELQTELLELQQKWQNTNDVLKRACRVQSTKEKLKEYCKWP